MDDEKNYGASGYDSEVCRACVPPPPASTAEGGRLDDSLDAYARYVAAEHRGGTWPVARACGEDPRVAGPDYQAAIRKICDELRDFLIEKNISYGNSAFEPINVFSKLPSIEGILLRIDDKLKRIKNGKSYPGDNDLQDLTGYLIILQVAMAISKEQ